MIILFYHSRKYMSPSGMLYRYMNELSSEMVYFPHIWAGAAQTKLSKIDSKIIYTLFYEN